MPREMIVDGNPTYPIAIRALQREGNLSRETRWRCQEKSNNLLEQDHRAVQRRVKAKQNFRSLAGARCTIAGYEAIHMIQKGQLASGPCIATDPPCRIIHQLLTQIA